MDLIEIMKMFGFPIAMCVAMMWWVYRREEREAKSQIDRESRMAHRLNQVSDQLLKLLQTVVQENTDSMRRVAHEIKAMREHCAERASGD